MLRLEQVSKEYPDGPATVAALRDVDLEVDVGAFVAVMGPSGSGKSTLALLATGVEIASSGRVLWEGEDLAAAGARRRARLRRRTIGAVFQSDDLDPVLDAAENVALPLRLDGWSRSRAEAAAGAALDRCGVGDLARRTPGEMSGGQRQRVSLARAVAGDRRLVVADEPTASLDTVTARSIVELLAELAGTGVGVLMTSHDARLAGFADEVVFLRDGARVADGAGGTARPGGAGR